MKKHNYWKIGTITLASSLVLGGVGTYFYQKNAKYYDEAKSGLVRGNKKTRIFHIPHCPNYDDISTKNLIEFQTIADAEKKNFRAAQNCPNNIVSIRRTFENE